MPRLMIFLCSFAMVFSPSAVRAEAGGMQAAVRLPVTVHILDYQTTRRICGGDDAPGWCPAHLLKKAGAGVSDIDDAGAADGISYANIVRRAAELERAEMLRRRAFR